MPPWAEQEYRESLRKEVEKCYDIATRARKSGLDVSDRVEIPLANDMADRVQELLELEGVSAEIRELSEKFSRDEFSNAKISPDNICNKHAHGLCSSSRTPYGPGIHHRHII